MPARSASARMRPCPAHARPGRRGGGRRTTGGAAGQGQLRRRLPDRSGGRVAAARHASVARGPGNDADAFPRRLCDRHLAGRLHQRRHPAARLCEGAAARLAGQPPARGQRRRDRDRGRVSRRQSIADPGVVAPQHRSPRRGARRGARRRSGGAGAPCPLTVVEHQRYRCACSKAARLLSIHER